MTFPVAINELINGSNINDDEYVIYAEKKNITKEFRCFIIADNKNYISTSSYIIDNEQNENEILTDEKAFYLIKVIENSLLYEIPLLTIDLCQLDTGEWKIIELNNPLFSGMYLKNSIAEILNEISIYIIQNAENVI